MSAGVLTATNLLLLTANRLTVRDMFNADGVNMLSTTHFLKLIIQGASVMRGVLAD